MQATARQFHTVLQDDRLSLYSPAALHSYMQQVRWLGVDQLRISAEWKLEAPAPDAQSAPAGLRADDPRWYTGPGMRLLDGAVRAASGAGLKLIVDPAFSAPRWATTDRAQGATPSDAWFNTNVDVRQAAAWETMLARRYNGTYVPAGETRPLPHVGTFTLWNEPNDHSFLKPQWSASDPVSADWSRRLTQLAYPAIKRVSPAASVLIGNTSESGSGRQVGSGGVAPLPFIRRLACVNVRIQPVHDGSCAHFRTVPADGYAHHPYERSEPPWRSSGPKRPDLLQMGDLARLRVLLDRLVATHRLAPGARRVWLTEQGYESNAELTDKPWSEAQQAQLNARAEYLAWCGRDINSFSQFLLGDTLTRETIAQRARTIDPRALLTGTWTTGLRREDLKPKLALWMFRSPVVVRALARHPAPGASPRAIGLEIWGRARPAQRPTLVEIQARANDSERFRFNRAVMTDSNGIFDVGRVWLTAAREFRLRWLDSRGAWQTSPSTRPVVIPSSASSATSCSAAGSVTRRR